MQSPSKKTVAVMQPYFLPYLGYFGLMARADEFVVLDCVQFPRRGRVHRSQLDDRRWLTLRLEAARQDTKICDMRFAGGAADNVKTQVAASAMYSDARAESRGLIDALLSIQTTSLVTFLVRQLVLVRDFLGLNCKISQSSDLALDPALKGQARIVEIARSKGATDYVNAPGGRDLYAREDFAAQQIELAFLQPYLGRFQHMIPALLSGQKQQMRDDLAAYANQDLVW